MIKQAVILCAGLSTRLRPLTDKMPKQMIPIGDKPLLEHLILNLKKHGVKEIFINLHYLPDIITDYFGDGKKFGLKINYAYEPILLGTAGGIKSFEKKLNKEFLVVYGDMWNEVDFQKFYEFHQSKKNSLSTVLVAKADRLDTDMVELDENHHFQKFYYRPHSADLKLKNKFMLNAAYIFSKKFLELVPVNKYSELDKGILPQILKNKWSIYGYPSNELVLDVGTFERLEKIKSIYNFKK